MSLRMDQTLYCSLNYGSMAQYTLKRGALSYVVCSLLSRRRSRLAVRLE